MVGCTYEKEELDNDKGKQKKSRGSSPEMRWGTECLIKGRQGPETRDLTKGERSLLLLALKTERERGRCVSRVDFHNRMEEDNYFISLSKGGGTRSGCSELGGERGG